jgi:hypothetical protein
MHTHKEGVPVENSVRKTDKSKAENGSTELKNCADGKKGHSKEAIPEAAGDQQVFLDAGFTTFHEQDKMEGGGKCVLVDRISDKSQILTNKAQVAANCAVRTAMATKNGIDMVENVVKCMRKITSSMNDVVESVEKLGQHSRNIEDTAITVGDIAKRTNIMAKSAVQKSVRPDNRSQNSDLIRKDMKQVARLVDEEAHITSECFNSLLADIEECVRTTNSAARRIEEGYKIANEARIAMDRIMDLVEEVSGQIDGIFEIADEVNTSSNDMIRIIDNLVHEVTGSSQQLEKISGELNGYIQRFQSYGQVMDAVTMRAKGIEDSNRIQSPGDREYSTVNSVW